MKRILLFFLGILLCLNCVLFYGCNTNNSSPKDDNKIKIGYLPITHSLPLYAEKVIEKEDIELVKFGSWPELMEALNCGEIDGASVLIELAMKAKSQGINIKAVALGHTDGNAVIVDEKIKNVKQLKGKTFAIPNKLSTHNILLYEMLKQNNMKASDLNIVELSPSEMPVALLEGRIDGYCVAEPFGAKSIVNGNAKVLYQSSDLMEDSICCALVLRDEIIKSSKAQDIINNYVKASEYLHDKDKASKLCSDYLKISDEVLNESLGWISFDKLKIEKQDYNNICDAMKELNLLDNIPTYEEFVDNSLLEKVS